MTRVPARPHGATAPVGASALAGVAEHAHAVDTGERGTDVALRDLGAAGAFDAAASGDWGRAAAVLDALGRECMSTAFSAWGHSMAIAYLREAGAGVPDALQTGETAGVSAMAPGFKHASGIGALPVSAQPYAGGYLLDGTIPWASNLFPGAIVILPVRLPGGEGRIARARIGAVGVTVKPSAPLLALNGTASGALQFEAARIEAGEVFEPPLGRFLAAVRAPFLLLQTAFCLGLAARCLDEATAAVHGGPTAALFAPRLAELRAESDRLRTEHATLLTGPTTPVRLLELRLGAGRLVPRATALEATLIGGRGYVAASPTARRLREGSFLPVQSPTEGHLEWELDRQRA